MYSSPPSKGGLLEDQLCSAEMTEWWKGMCFIARSVLTPSTQTSTIPSKQAALMAFMEHKENEKLNIVPAENFIFTAIHQAAVSQPECAKSSLVFPAIITRLCAAAGVLAQRMDVVAAPPLTISRQMLKKAVNAGYFYCEPLENTFLKKDISAMLAQGRAEIEKDLKTLLTKEMDVLASRLAMVIVSGAPDQKVSSRPVSPVHSVQKGGDDDAARSEEYEDEYCDAMD